MSRGPRSFFQMLPTNQYSWSNVIFLFVSAALCVYMWAQQAVNKMIPQPPLQPQKRKRKKWNLKKKINHNNSPNPKWKTSMTSSQTWPHRCPQKEETEGVVWCRGEDYRCPLLTASGWGWVGGGEPKKWWCRHFRGPLPLLQGPFPHMSLMYPLTFQPSYHLCTHDDNSHTQQTVNKYI